MHSDAAVTERRRFQRLSTAQHENLRVRGISRKVSSLTRSNMVGSCRNFFR